MDFDISKITPHQTYNLLMGLIAPRPIAWITSLDLEGRVNAAPFSAFNYMGVDPPIVAIGVGNRPGPGVIKKDTAQNIRNTREFVINVVTESLAESMNICGIEFPPGVDELEIANLQTTPSKVVRVPRILESPACLECREFTTIEVGNSRVILGQVVGVHVQDQFIDPAGHILADKLHAIGRMNGLGNYVKTRSAFFEMPRMNYEEWLKKNPSK